MMRKRSSVVRHTMVVVMIILMEAEARYHLQPNVDNDDDDDDRPPPGNHNNNNGNIVPSDPALPFPSDQPAATVFDVTSFGAAGDGSSDDTSAFRAAWKAACAVDSGTVVVPSGGCFKIRSTIFSGPCKPGLVFQVDGVLTPPDGPDSWPVSDSRRQWLVFYRLDGVTLSGAGTVDGLGHKWWDMPCKPHRGPDASGPCDSPALIRFFMSSNVAVRGLSIKNSPQFHVKFDGCRGVVISEVTISSPKLSPNTDGIHIEGTTEVGIYDSRIANGDDCISIGPGCADVDVRGVTCGPSHGISIGSLGVHNTRACVSNVTVRDCVIRESDNGVRIKTWQGGSGAVTGVVFDNILMENVRNCIVVDQYYCSAGGSKGCGNQSSAVWVSDVQYREIKGTYDVRAPPVRLACSDAVPCTNITISDVELLPYEGQLLDDPFCWNAYGLQQTLTIPPMDCLQQGLPLSLMETHTQGC